MSIRKEERLSVRPEPGFHDYAGINVEYRHAITTLNLEIPPGRELPPDFPGDVEDDVRPLVLGLEPFERTEVAGSIRRR